MSVVVNEVSKDGDVMFFVLRDQDKVRIRMVSSIGAMTLSMTPEKAHAMATAILAEVPN